MAINSQPRADRPSCQQIGFCFQGCKSSAKWSTLYTEIPAAIETGKLELRPECQVLQIQHDDAGKVTGVLYADKDGNQQVQKARVVAVAGNSIESPRLLLNSASAKFPDGLANTLGPGRQELHAAHDRLGLRRLRQARAHVPRHHHGRHRSRTRPSNDPKRGFVGGYELETLSLGLPFMAAFLDPGAWGRELHPQDGATTRTWPACGSSARTCRRRATASRCTRPRRTSSACRSRTSISTTTRTTSRCAATPIRQGTAVYQAAGAREVYETPPYPSTHNLGTNRMSDKPATAWSTSMARPTTSRTCSSPTAASSPPAGPRTRR